MSTKHCLGWMAVPVGRWSATMGYWMDSPLKGSSIMSPLLCTLPDHSFAPFIAWHLFGLSLHIWILWIRVGFYFFLVLAAVSFPFYFCAESQEASFSRISSLVSFTAKQMPG